MTGTKKSDKGSDKAEAEKKAAFSGDGDFQVGSDVKPGTYRTTGNDDGMCYWERAKDTSGEMDSLLANDNVTGTSYVTEHVLGEFVGDPPVVGVAHGILGHELRPAVGHAEDALPHLGTLGKTRHLQLHAITVGRGPSHRKACFPDRDGPSVRVEPRRCLGRVAAGRQLLAGAAREDLLHRGLLGGRDP